MAATANNTAPETTEEVAAKAVHKRYEGLVMVRTKAIKGKGAWYWAHLEPTLVHNSDTGLPKAVKLRCQLCDAVFSASNPSRTASEHLKRGTCPNFNTTDPTPISSVSPTGIVSLASPSPSSSSSPHQNHRKRSFSGSNRAAAAAAAAASAAAQQNTPTSFHPTLPVVDPTRFSVDISYPTRPESVQALPSPPPATAAVAVSSGGGSGLYGQAKQQQQQHLLLSGGKEDLGALAMLEDSVKKLKSPKSLPGPILNKIQIDSSLDFLADWVYECCGSVSFSSLDHPKFKSFMNQVGLPEITRRDLAGDRLDTRYEEAKAESEARIRDAMFFQISSEGWKSKPHLGDENLVNLSLNLPNGTSVFRRAIFTSGFVPSKYAEEVLFETLSEICSGNNSNLQQCVGIVSDRFKAKALRNLENQHQWMVNLPCQFHGVTSLVKDLSKDLPLFNNVTENCLKLANFVNSKPQVRNCFHKYQLQEYGRAGLLRMPVSRQRLELEPVSKMVEDVLSCARALQLVVMDESCKVVPTDEEINVGRDIEEMLRNPRFWNELEAVHSLVKLIREMAQEIEKERPRIGQCLPLWEELRVKIKDWCIKFHISETQVERVIDKRFKKNYHPAWAAAFILDPFYLIRDTSGKYLPPFKCLTPDQEKDVDKLITRLVSREEAHIALMELMKWRTEGLDPVYAQAVQLKQKDPVTGKMRIANPQSSRLVWETYLTEFKSLRKVAVRLIFLHATTSCGFKCNWSFSRSWVHSRSGMEKAQKLIFIAAHSKLERRDFSNDDDKDAEFFALANGEDDVLNEVFVDASSL